METGRAEHTEETNVEYRSEQNKEFLYCSAYRPRKVHAGGPHYRKNRTFDEQGNAVTGIG